MSITWFKQYEQPWQLHIPPKSYVVIRVDGRAFHSLTKDMEKPFDHGFMRAMDKTAIALCQEIQGAQFAYVQSDEISVLITDFNPNQQQWFGGEVIKMVSISAALATNAFWYSGGLFDSRVFTLPNRAEAMHYFMSRQNDCQRNAISMIAQAHFSHSDLYRKSCGDMVLMLGELGVILTDYPAGARRGRVITKNFREEEISFTHKKTHEVKQVKVLRSFWEASDAPWFDDFSAHFLDRNTPHCKEKETDGQANNDMDSERGGTGPVPQAGEDQPGPDAEGTG